MLSLSSRKTRRRLPPRVDPLRLLVDVHGEKQMRRKDITEVLYCGRTSGCGGSPATGRPAFVGVNTVNIHGKLLCIFWRLAVVGLPTTLGSLMATPINPGWSASPQPAAARRCEEASCVEAAGGCRLAGHRPPSDEPRAVSGWRARNHRPPLRTKLFRIFARGFSAYACHDTLNINIEDGLSLDSSMFDMVVAAVNAVVMNCHSECPTSPKELRSKLVFFS
ncbi:hypothetical protein KSP39_PZI009476 [Platanthera zijinensis]|uniref:Uncharacterized protein n=1 Tax=Platanthera zijinensis TaxID=2320716 RepID=A0AAP0G7R6_9ASPA